MGKDYVELHGHRAAGAGRGVGAGGGVGDARAGAVGDGDVQGGVVGGGDGGQEVSGVGNFTDWTARAAVGSVSAIVRDGSALGWWFQTVEWPSGTGAMLLKMLTERQWQ